MIRLLRWLWTGDGHAHRWKIICENPYQWKAEFSSGNGTEYTLQCEACGRIRRDRP